MDTARARSFGAVAQTYDRARATYPRAAVEWALAAASGRAGRVVFVRNTGKLCFATLQEGLSLSDTGVRLQVMLSRDEVGEEALAGTAEQVPLPDASVDAVLVGQAWHWFDQDAALAEVRRVLRPGGAVGLLWNVFDDRVPWVAALVQATGAEDRRSAMDDTPPLPGAERREIGHSQPMTRDLLADNIASRSAVVLMAPAERAELLRRVRELAPADEVDVPWVCDTWRLRLP